MPLKLNLSVAHEGIFLVMPVNNLLLPKGHSLITYGWYCSLRGFLDHNGDWYNFQSQVPQLVDYSPLCFFQMMYQNKWNYPHGDKLAHHAQDYWKCDSKCNTLLDNETEKLPHMNLGQTCKYLKNFYVVCPTSILGLLSLQQGQNPKGRSRSRNL